MKRHLLMFDNEPNDKQLSQLMKEVAMEAKKKALLVGKKLHQEIAKQIYKSNKAK